MLRPALAAALVALPAAAQDVEHERKHGFYFNRPGATLAQAQADTAECARVVAGGKPGAQYVVASNPIAMGVGMLFAGLLQANAGKKLTRDNIEQCMLLKGWRAVALTNAEGDALRALPDAERLRRVETEVGADTPALGRVVATWTNAYAEPRFPEETP